MQDLALLQKYRRTGLDVSRLQSDLKCFLTEICMGVLKPLWSSGMIADL